MDLIPTAGWQEILQLLFLRRRLLRIRGESMAPRLPAGSVILLDPFAYRRQIPEVGEVVVASHPEKAELSIVKRVGNIEADGRLFLISDNRAMGNDSRSFGPIPTHLLKGRVRSRIPL